jgi:hypothetical protein
MRLEKINNVPRIIVKDRARQSDAAPSLFSFLFSIVSLQLPSSVKRRNYSLYIKGQILNTQFYKTNKHSLAGHQ